MPSASQCVRRSHRRCLRCPDTLDTSHILWMMSCLRERERLTRWIAPDVGAKSDLYDCLVCDIYTTAVYIDRTPATNYLSNAFRALFVDRVDSASPFASSFRNLRNVPEFWSVRIPLWRTGNAVGCCRSFRPSCSDWAFINRR